MRIVSASVYMSLARVACRLAADDVLYFDDTVGLLVFGGSELHPSFQGYIGQAVLYRQKAVSAHEVSSDTYSRARRIY